MDQTRTPARIVHSRRLDRGRRQRDRARAIGALGLLFASVLALAGCYTGPSAEHFLAIVDELDVPAGWQVAKTVVRGPDQSPSCSPGLSNECPAAIRYYVTDADMVEAYDLTKALVSGAGFSIGDESTAGCAAGSSSRPCGFFANRGSDQLHARAYITPDEAGLAKGTPGGVTVVVRAYST